MSNAYLDALGRLPRGNKPAKKRLNPSQKRAVKQERETALRLGGSRTPASGARDVKGDVRVKRIARIECKTTKHKSFSVTLDMVRKIEEAALSAGEIPVLVVEFNDGVRGRLAEVAIIPSYLLEEFIEAKK